MLVSGSTTAMCYSVSCDSYKQQGCLLGWSLTSSLGKPLTNTSSSSQVSQHAVICFASVFHFLSHGS